MQGRWTEYLIRQKGPRMKHDSRQHAKKSERVKLLNKVDTYEVIHTSIPVYTYNWIVEKNCIYLSLYICKHVSMYVLILHSDINEITSSSLTSDEARTLFFHL